MYIFSQSGRDAAYEIEELESPLMLSIVPVQAAQFGHRLVAYIVTFSVLEPPKGKDIVAPRRDNGYKSSPTVLWYVALTGRDGPDICIAVLIISSSSTFETNKC